MSGASHQLPMTTPADPSIHHRTFTALTTELLPLPRAEVLGLTGSSGAYLAAGLLAAGEPRLAVLAPDQAAAQQFSEALAFYHGRPGEVALFPGWELDPYAPLSPHPDVEAQRLATLTALAAGRLRAVVTTVRALQQRLIPRTVLASLQLVLEAGSEYPRDQLLARLMALGYQRVPLVEERGTFAVRGDLVDLFPPAFASPVRLVFFGDELEELRPIAALTQRPGGEGLSVLELSPAREMILAGEHLASYCVRVRERCDELELPRSVREALLSEARE
jgi:transcription-repair coupling factor (superfamily II helicase)